MEFEYSSPSLPHPARRNKTGMPGVKKHRQARPGDDFVQVVCHSVIGLETLHSGVKFKTLYPEFFHQTPCLACTHAAFVRVNAGKGDHHVGVLGGNFGDFLIGDTPPAEIKIRVNTKHDKGDFALAAIFCRFLDGGPVGGFEISGERLVKLRTKVVVRLTARDLGVGVHVYGNNVL